MFENKEDLLEFLLLCRDAKIKAIKVGDIEVQFHDLAFFDELSSPVPAPIASTEPNRQATEAAESDDDLLFWSSKA